MSRPMLAFLRQVDTACEAHDAAEPTLTDLEHAFALTRDRVAAAENHLAEVTAELDGIEAAIAARVQALGLRHHRIAAT
jgi:hypothetical protein